MLLRGRQLLRSPTTGRPPPFSAPGYVSLVFKLAISRISCWRKLQSYPRKLVVPLLPDYHSSLSPSSFATRKYGSLCDLDVLPLNQKLFRLIWYGRVSEARQLFDDAHARNTVTWNTMMTGYIRQNRIVEARQLFDEMPQRDLVSWNLIVSGYLSCKGRRYVDEGGRLFDRMPERDSVSFNTMISGYTKSGRMDEALKVFNQMPQRDIVSWNAMVTGYLENGDVIHGVELFHKMPKWDTASLCALVSGLIRNGLLDEAAAFLLDFDRKNIIEVDLIPAYNTLIAAYGHAKKVNEARKIFERIPSKSGQGGAKFEKNLVSWNTMIMCYVKAGDIVLARELFDQMEKRDTFSWNTMISGYVHKPDVVEATKLFNEMPNPDTLTWNLMILGHAQSGNLNHAQTFFEKMPWKNFVSWNSMIAGYEKNEDYNGAMKLFVRMRDEGERPDHHTLSSVLSVSAGMVDLHLGMQLHQLVTKMVIPDLPIRNALITMYSKCGQVNEAWMIFNDAKPQKDVITWNAIIGGYASHGYASEALTLFHSMKCFGVQPSYITFISVLHACANAGLVEEGRRIFKSMVSEYGIEPRVEHYASLVDLLARQGQLAEALDVIKSMPFKPDKAVWGALLNACTLHNNVEMARVAAEALMKIEPESSAPYVLLSNLYANASQWDDATETRMLMEKNNVQKQPAGKSFKFSRQLSKKSEKKAACGDAGIPIKHLHKLNTKYNSDWNMKRLMRIVSRHWMSRFLGLMSTMMNPGPRSGTSIRVIIYTCAILYIYLEDLMSFMRNDEAIKTMSFFEGPSEADKIISKGSLKSTIL